MNTTHSSRRRFFRQAALGTAGLVLAPSVGAVSQPFARSGDSRIRLALAAYSFRDYFPYSKERKVAEVPEEVRMNMPKFIRYCAQHGLDGAELTSYHFNPDDTAEDFLACRHQAHINGVSIAGTAIGNNFSHPKDSSERARQMEYVRTWIDRAALMGAPHIRVFAGVPPKGVSEEELEANAISALAEAAEYAGSKGIFLGIENHDSISTPERLLRITRGVDSPWVGINLDTGNFRGGDPYAAIAECAPYAVNVQLKVRLDIEGKKVEADIPRIVRLLREANYQGFLVLEYEETANPYEAIPPLLETLRKELA
ncbi:sugar phosphate isomerase/epimerase family protein [Roseibacillus ishigakijimensis]|uniref:Sugar phosphate isomerase/epimerase n=1 Tax=Roseibacillus ishigakijimensis TaxID=454146 RepID=A0A934VGR7_9BACT|nr:sugar phosphate isomerase/epimerase family protein [Roseibacillus ishigakijimensis]MBK1833148.1 sugar phosphate isomerase/epimerase [Roseibacillus ishigakijimensis]